MNNSIEGWSIQMIAQAACYSVAAMVEVPVPSQVQK